MTKPTKLTPAMNRKITTDWRGEIPSLGVYKPRWLMRRVGPLLVGICLDRDSSGTCYMPEFHVHFLGKPCGHVSLTLWAPLRTERTDAPQSIDVRWHDEKYREAATRMVRQSLLPLEGDLTLAQVIAAYRRHMDTPLARRVPIHLYHDMVLLLAWGGDSVGSAALLSECLGLDDMAGFQHVGGRKAFEAGCRRCIENPALIEATVAEEIEALRVRKLPVAELIR